jgi:hypothetical protein
MGMSRFPAYILHHARLPPIVGDQISSRDNNPKLVGVLEKLQLGVHGTRAIHWREAEADIGGCIGLHLLLLQILR